MSNDLFCVLLLNRQGVDWLIFSALQGRDVVSGFPFALSYPKVRYPPFCAID